MLAQRVASAIVLAVGLISPQAVRAQNGWPAPPATTVEAKPKAEAAPKPAAPKALARADARKTVPVAPKTAVVEVEQPAPAAAKVEAAPVVTSAPPSVLQSLTELLARQTVAMEALLRRLDASETRLSSVPTAAESPAIDRANAAPMAPAVATPAAQSAQIAPRPMTQAAPSSAGVSRWGDVQSFNLGFRYRYVDNSAGVRTADQGQSRSEFKGRFKFDRAGHYALNTGVFTGPSNTVSWNNTGMGSGDPARDLHLKQMYFAAAPAGGLELQYGGLYAVRGEGTEITTYDNDFYLTGQRVTVKRPKQLWFDEISATQAYLGDGKQPDMWDRYQRLAESNYYQLLVGKKFGRRVGVSADYTDVDGVPTWRSALLLKAQEMRALDGFRVETYARSEVGSTPFGWALTLDKKVRRTSISGGFASIDEHYGGLNGDFYVRGDRWFGKATANLFPLLSVAGQYTHALDADYAIANQERFDVVFTYDVLKTFAPTSRR